MTPDGLTALGHWFLAVYNFRTSAEVRATWVRVLEEDTDEDILGAADDWARHHPERAPTIAQLRAMVRDSRPSIFGRTGERGDPSAPYTIREVPALADPDHPLETGIRPAEWNPYVWLRAQMPRQRGESAEQYAARLKAKDRWLPWITMEQFAEWIEVLDARP